MEFTQVSKSPFGGDKVKEPTAAMGRAIAGAFPERWVVATEIPMPQSRVPMCEKTAILPIVAYLIVD
jgi:hypothetical protein